MTLSRSIQLRRSSRHSSTLCRPVFWLVLIGSGALFGCQSTSVPAQAQVVAVDPTDIVQPPSPQNVPEQIQPSRVQPQEHSTASPLAASNLPWLSTIQDDFQLARQLVEQELNIELGAVKLHVVDDNPINEQVALETQRLIEEQFGASEFATHFLDQVMHPLAGTYAALYSSTLKAVMISRSMLASYERSLNDGYEKSTKRAALLTLLIHELVHAADDKRYHIHKNRALNFRASFAQSATFEGHAQWVTRRICKKAGCIEGLQALDDFMFSGDEPTTQVPRPAEETISRGVLEYSYVEGERFIEALAQRDNGAQLIDSLLRSPPSDPIQILAPDSYPDSIREVRNQQLIQASRNIQHRWTSTPWIGVDTSPLKGVDLRSDPARRQAAVDGFTLLIQGMISMQFYDQTRPGALPVESTVLQADAANTARLFASTLHANTQHSGAQINDERLTVSTDSEDTSTPLDLHIYRTALDSDNVPFRTTIAVSGLYVVQVSGSDIEQTELDDYAVRVLMNLNGLGKYAAIR